MARERITFKKERKWERKNVNFKERKRRKHLVERNTMKRII